MMMAMTIITLGAVAEAQSVDGLWTKHDIRGCYRTAGEDIVKCDIGVTALNSTTYDSPGSPVIFDSEGTGYSSYAITYDGKNLKEVSRYGDYTEHRFGQFPTKVTYLFKVPTNVTQFDAYQLHTDEVVARIPIKTIGSAAPAPSNRTSMSTYAAIPRALPGNSSTITMTGCTLANPQPSPNNGLVYYTCKSAK